MLGKRGVTKVRIVEEWGFNIGEDACLFEEVEDGSDNHTEKEERQMDPGIDVNADILVENLVKELVESEGHVNSNGDDELLVDSNSDAEVCTSNHSNHVGEFPLGTDASPVLLVPIAS